MFCHAPRCRPSPSFRPERPLCRGVACPEPVEGEESRRRLPVLALEVEPGSLRSLRSVGMTVGKWGGGSENCVCHEMSCFVMLGRDSPRWPPCSLSAAAPSSPFPCAVRTRQTVLSNTFFYTRLSVRSRAAGPDRRKPPAGAARRRGFVHIMFLCGRQALSCGVSVRVPACGFLCERGKAARAGNGSDTARARKAGSARP